MGIKSYKNKSFKFFCTVLNYKVLFFFFCIFRIGLSPVFPKTIVIDEPINFQRLGLYIEYLEDKEGKLDIDNVRDKKNDKLWLYPQAERINMFFTNSVYWFKFEIWNSTGKDMDFLIEQDEPLISSIDLYVPEKDSYHINKSGMSIPFEERPFKHRTFVFPVKIQSKASLLFYLRCRSKATVNLGLNLWDPAFFKAAASHEYYILMIFYGILLVIFFYNLTAFFFIRRPEFIFFSFFTAMTLLFWMMLDGTAAQFLWPGSPSWSELALYLLLNLMMIFLGLFFICFADLKILSRRKKYLKISYRAALSFITVFFLLSVLNFFFSDFSLIKISSVFSGLFIVYIFTQSIILVFKEKSREALWCLAAASPVFIGALTAVLRSCSLLPLNLLTQFGTQAGLAIMFVLFSVALSDRTNKMFKEFKESNNSLEDNTIGRIEELQADKNDLESSNEKYKIINETLLKRNKELEYSQGTVNTDIQIFINLQASILPKTPPSIKGWEIAFNSSPVSGISGDFFDFYTDIDKLEGMVIFDVSGSGIATGLITMISRDIFSRNFHTDRGEILGRVFEKSNIELITKIGSVDNYLTGIMLRFNEDEVEYVNAAHPGLIHKKYENDDVYIVNDDDNNFKGFLIGAEGFEGAYETFKFKVQKNDVLLLNTDCIYKGKNPSGEEYGIKRLLNALGRAPDGTAVEVMDFLLKDFNSFIRNERLRDDLTVIILKKQHLFHS